MQAVARLEICTVRIGLNIIVLLHITYFYIILNSCH